MKTENKATIPMNLQFFAENSENSDSQAQNQEPDSQNSHTQNQETDSQTATTLEEALAELAKERAERAKEKAEKEKIKSNLDEALKKVGDLTKTVRQNMTEKQIEDEAERERKEQEAAEFSRLREFEKKTLAEKRYIMQGMNPEMAEKAAKAEVEGDMDMLATIQRQHTESLIKAKEAEWKKSRPPVNAGMDGEFSVTKEQFDKMGYAKRVELKNKNPELYKQFTEQ